jgi:hypothetical protein
MLAIREIERVQIRERDEHVWRRNRERLRDMKVDRYDSREGIGVFLWGAGVFVAALLFVFTMRLVEHVWPTEPEAVELYLEDGRP